MGQYGKDITVKDASELLTSMMAIKGKFDEPINMMTKKDPTANRFYCGGDAVFIFGKDSLRNLWDRCTGEDADCIFAVYPASRKDEPGRPTLMVFIYQKAGDGNYHLITSPLKSGDDGIEHPGGNGNFELKKSASGLYEIPEIIQPSQITFALQ